MSETIPVTVVIPFHPNRKSNGMLDRALRSIDRQTMQPEWVITVEDVRREGAPKTRQRGLDQVETEWVTFLDSDDEMKPEHLESLYQCALETEADLVYSWYEIVGGRDPMAVHFGKPWDPDNPRLTTIVTFCKTEVAQHVGFVFQPDGFNPGQRFAGEDKFFTNGINNLGAKIVHLPKKTWVWHHHGRNSSGMPTKGDAR